MANRWLLTCCILFMTLLQICSSTWPHFNRDFLFLPKLIPKHLNNPANRETLFEANHPRPRTVIYNRSKLDPTNTNVYQDSATVKISENRSTDKPEEEIIMDDETQLSNNTNVYVPVMVKKKKKNPNLKKDTTNVRDVSLHGNNFQVTNNHNNNRRTNPREDFIDEDFLDQSKHLEPPKHQEQDDHHHHRNDHRRANRRNPFNDDSISKDFEEFFKLDDLKDFFDSKIIV